MQLIKKKQKTRNNISFPKPTNTNNTNLRKKQKGITIKKSKTRYKTTRKKPKLKNNIIAIIFLIAIIGLSILAVRYITQLRNKAKNTTYENENVVGLDNIPAYPGSEFIFERETDEAVVKEYLTSGNSAYRLPKGATMEELLEYYKETLPKKGWTLVMSVEVGNEEMEYGDYYTKEGKGLRIYSKYKDVWYETVTEKEATEGLATRVKEEIEREMILAGGEYQTFLPDFPWVLNTPKEYIISYRATDFSDFRSASLAKIGSKEEVKIYPLGYQGAKFLDTYLEDMAEALSTEEDICGVYKAQITSFRGLNSLTGTIRCTEMTWRTEIVQNTFNDVIYAFCTNTDTPFFQYLLENIIPLGEQDPS